MKLKILTRHLLIGRAFRKKCIFTDNIIKEFFILDKIYLVL